MFKAACLEVGGWGGGVTLACGMFGPKTGKSWAEWDTVVTPHPPQVLSQSCSPSGVNQQYPDGNIFHPLLTS